MRRRRTDDPDPVERRPGETDAAYLSRLVHAHLDPDDAAAWLALTRPAVRLAAAAGGDEVVARLGGRPVVPDDFEWPVWGSHGPLAFVGELDLAALARTGHDPGVALPTDGRLLAFCFDGSDDAVDSVVGPWDEESRAGARLLHLPGDRARDSERAAPEHVLEFPPQSLAARAVVTFADPEHPVWEQAGLPELDDPLIEQLGEFHDGEPLHQVGGWAVPLQGSVELEVADDEVEAMRWRPVLQIDSDEASAMMWGDVGRLYWLTRPDAVATEVLGRVSFTWQSG